MTQLRFKKDRLLDDNFYIRGDGTRVYFFEEGTPQTLPMMAVLLRRRLTVDELEEMFSEFVVEQLVVDRRLLVNRQNLKKMYRVWYQGRFRKRREGEELKDAKNAEGVGERGVGEEGVRDVDETIEG
jgi:tRNAThr (cytosine32-N3)-methyltransferase